MDNVTVFTHPLIQHKLTLLRDENTGTKDFRNLVEEIAMLMSYEVFRDLPTEEITVKTPLAETKSRSIAGKKITLIPILRAGLGMVDGVLRLVPSARIGHVGVYRDEETLEPQEYYCKTPSDIDQRQAIILDPMLATGGSACAAINFLKQRGCSDIRLVCIISAPEGVARVNDEHPDVPIYTCSIDDGLNEIGYILPGLGDAGDRIFGTK